MKPVSKQPLLAIYGASGHAMVVADIVRLQGVYKIVGFLDDVNPDRHGSEFCKASILGGREQLCTLMERGVRHVLVGFGNCKLRLELTAFLQEQGFVLPVAVHPRAIVAEDVELSPGTVIAGGAVVNPGTRIGGSVIINTAASVDHECILEHGVHISPGAHLSGRVVVGRAAWIGIGAAVVDRVHIGAGTVIGAGAVVINDMPDDVIAYGVPAKVIRKKTSNDSQE
jgi:UDP-N-acetylbacillosamine N-acetyltransferase